MIVMKRSFNDRNFLLIAALILGLLWEGAAGWSEHLMFPALALIMTVAVMGITGEVFTSVRMLLLHGLTGILMSYAVHGLFLLGLSDLFIHDQALWSGFVILAAVPPAVAVIPFSVFLNGNSALSLIGTVGSYLGALLIAPFIALTFLGSNFISPGKVLLLIAELILIPVILARFLTWSGLSRIIDPVRSLITNWSFFLITYTIIALNRDIFIAKPLSLLPVAFIAFSGTFLLGWFLEIIAKKMRLDRDVTVSIVLLGTLKNYGLSGGLALSFLDQRAAIPSTVSVVFMVIYIIWLEFRKRRSDKATKER
jgi:bile acid:Na+ symporter, BASS family